MSSTIVTPFFSPPVKSFNTSSLSPQLIRMAARANHVSQESINSNRGLFFSCHSPIATPVRMHRSVSLYVAPGVDLTTQETFRHQDDFETLSHMSLLPCPYDNSPMKQFPLSPDKEEVDSRNNENSTPFDESVMLFPDTPTNNTAAAEVNHQTPQQPKRKRAFDENSPSTPLLSPEAREKFGKIASPLWTHDASNYNKKPRNSKEKMKFKQELKKLAKKLVHTFEVESPTKSRAIQTTPDKEGRLKQKGRYYRLHEPAVDPKDPSGKKPNRIIPAIGPFCIRQPGSMSENMVTEYGNSPVNETFNQFLTRECPKIFATLHPNSTQKLETTGLDFMEA